MVLQYLCQIKYYNPEVKQWYNGTQWVTIPYEDHGNIKLISSLAEELGTIKYKHKCQFVSIIIHRKLIRSD